MRPTITFLVRPRIPKALDPLSELARNLWFTWNPEAVDLFKRADGRLWEQTGHNPVELLNRINQNRLDALAADDGFLAEMDRIYGQLKTYLSAQSCPYLGGRALQINTVAYFSAEFGLADCLPIYSGGLGVLSGDHLKSASNLNLPLVGVGLAYGQGYFTQYLNPDGWQQEELRPNDFWSLPMELVLDPEGEPLTIEVTIEGKPLKARIWKVRVGRIPLYLMDSDMDENPPELRVLTQQLYGGDREMRIRQEILLGIGGVRMLAALGIEPDVIHMNEGHSAFAALEMIRRLRQEQGLNFDQAREVVRACTCFTTHTPVPAGNDYFEPELVKRHFKDYVAEMGLSLPVLMGYGRIDPYDQEEMFCMTVLALRLCSFANGVSRLHGQVSRGMWKELWPHFPEEDAPIGHITNGVHIPSWVSSDLAYLYSRYLGTGWIEDPDSQSIWSTVDLIPNAELWRVHDRDRGRMVSFVRSRLIKQLDRRGASAHRMTEAEEALNAEALTIGFARRFATYKRAVLLLSNPDRLAAILNDPQRPVQIIFAGKAHPKDNEGKEFIRQVVALCRDPRFAGRMVFIEDYDLNVARHLVQGVDVWLNTPRRPLEACGTSGMKAAANGALNLSVPDGWWDEGYEPGLGWTIGGGETYGDTEEQDQIEARTLYRLLEDELVPLFYDRHNGGIPRGWIANMKKCLATICPQFNTHRMLEDYVELAYMPAATRHQALMENDWKGAKELGGWVQRIMESWSRVKVLEVSSPDRRDLVWGDTAELSAKVNLAELTPEDVACDIYYGPLDGDGDLTGRHTQAMQAGGSQDGVWEFTGQVNMQFTGRMGLKIRVTPHHPLLSGSHSLGLAVWGG